MEDSRYDDILELYLRIKNPINTCSIITIGNNTEWVDTVADICSLKEELYLLLTNSKGA